MSFGSLSEKIVNGHAEKKNPIFFFLSKSSKLCSFLKKVKISIEIVTFSEKCLGYKWAIYKVVKKVPLRSTKYLFNGLLAKICAFKQKGFFYLWIAKNEQNSIHVSVAAFF